MKAINFCSNLCSWQRLAQVGMLGSSIVVMSMLNGCATKPTYQTAPSVNSNIVTNQRGVPNYYLVKRGDTVSQIAARYGLNYRQIGALNNLDNKYTIYTGQWLALWSSNNLGNGSSRPTYQTPSRQPITQRPNYQQNNGYGNNPYNNNDYNNGRGQQATTGYPVPPITNPNPSIYEPVIGAETGGYRYPSNNQVIQNFGDRAGAEGMWFAGRQGDPVLASKAGRVMYSGNGLEEYGNLIMIQHEGDYITAYAHNDQLLVKENDQVQQGQQIAKMGRTGNTNQVALEFQVRYMGKAIDPRVVLGR